jgi:hypothetical protein
MPYFGNNPSPLLLNTVAQNGKEMTLDADADTSITADTDDQIDIKIGGADDFQFTANTFTAQSGSTIAAQALTATTITASGIVKTDDTTDATTTTDGSLQTDGGLSVVKDAVFGDDVKLLSDSAVLSFGADSEITLTHVHNSGLKLNDGKILYLGDDQDFQFYHNNSSNLQVIDANARLLIRSPRIDFQNGDGTETTGVSIADGVFSLFYDNTEKFTTASTGITVTGTVLSDRGTESAPGYSFSDDTDTGMFNVSNADLAFSVGGTERMRIDSSGNIGVGTSSPTSGYKMHLYNVGAGAGMLIQGLGAGIEAYLALQGETSSGSTRNLLIKIDNGDLIRFTSPHSTSIRLETSDSECLLLGSDGSLRLQHVYDDTTSNSANMYIHSDGTHQVLRSTSSERYKKDIETLEDKYADAVLGLRPVWYKSKCAADNADHSHWGLIAEEVAKVDPRLVTFRNEYTEDIGDGNTKVVKLTEPQAESVQYDRFVPHLINICKRQEDKITALEAKVKALEEA